MFGLFSGTSWMSLSLFQPQPFLGFVFLLSRDRHLNGLLKMSRLFLALEAPGSNNGRHLAEPHVLEQERLQRSCHLVFFQKMLLNFLSSILSPPPNKADAKLQFIKQIIEGDGSRGILPLHFPCYLPSPTLSNTYL